MSRLIAVSNRTASDLSSRAGGLAVAVWEALVDTGGLWCGWSGKISDQKNRSVTTMEEDGVEFAVTDLSPQEHDGYYLGYANSVLWPIFHYRIDLASFDDDAFRTYMLVNRRIAKIVSNRAVPGDSIWVHDYHFLLLGSHLRDNGWRGPIGFFLHIPFPPPEIFRAVPEHQQLARALCHYDVIGLQSQTDRANFVRYLVDNHGALEGPDDEVRVFDQRVKVRAYPIGIEADAYAGFCDTEDAKAAAARVHRMLGDRELVIGVDRMDYSKGLPERFDAVGRFFDSNPDYRGKVSVMQIAPPSRSKVEEYRQLRRSLDSLAGRINGDYGDLDWIPLRYLARSFDRTMLAGVHRLARVCLVTPLRDGMNLVSKEFVMAQDPENPGVLILSEFAGAAEQLGGDALIVNPHDTGAMADAIRRALDMPLTERKQRWQRLRSIIREQDIAWWRQAFLNDLGAVEPV